MRELKFRAWDLVTVRMVHVSVVEFDAAGAICNIAFYDGLVNTNRGAHSRFQQRENGDDLALMQFTGLKDKNGNEIYEGDVVQHREKEVGKLEVQFWEGQWVGVADDTACQPLWDNDWNKKAKGEYKQHNLEIIGNIYENPDLLT